MYARRIQKLPPYLFAEIDRLRDEKRAEGVDVIDLGVGDPDIPTPDHIVEAMKDAVEDVSTHTYPSYRGSDEFREAVAAWYGDRFGVELDLQDEVLALIGGKEGVAHTPLGLVDPGDVVLAPDPGYTPYRIGPILADASPVPLPLKRENDFLPDLDAVDPQVAQDAKLMFLNYPNNPTGATAPKSFFEEVVEFARENDVVVAHDNPYSEMTFDGYEAPSFLEVDGAREVGIEYHSLSKTYSMTGWRIGMAVGNPDVLEGLGKVKTNVDSGVFRAVQKAGVAALQGGVPEEYMERYRERRDVMVDALNDLGLDAEPQRATFYLWVPVPEGYDSMEFTKLLLDEAGITATPGVGFGKHGEGFVRFALTRDVERLREAAGRLEDLDL